MTRLLYLGAANLADPRAGMDIASRYHFEELAADRRLEVSGISVSPSITDPTQATAQKLQMLGSDLPRGMDRLGKLKLKAGLLARGAPLFQSVFLSNDARARVTKALATRPDLLFIDHIASLANLSLGQLIRLRLGGRTKIVVAAHDISSKLMQDRAAVHPSRLKALAIRLSALHFHLYENVVFRLAHKVWFISTNDRENFSYIDKAKTIAMCQAIESPVAGDPAALQAKFGRYLVFVGSPSFFPNEAAIGWINGHLAPELLKLMPELKILLVGKGTDTADVALPPNVTGLGFVDNVRLSQVVRGAAGVISPVVHGSGIKIKVLEAIAAGRPVFATDHSLRGYEFMEIDPLLDVADPARSARNIAEIVGDPDRLERFADHIAARWNQFKEIRRGRLADFVHQLAS